ncbi:MAG: hypothetical protein WBK28_02030 [Minisyncoccia bacterium]
MSATFYPPKDGLLTIALIDPKKGFGETGQYTKYEGDLRDMIKHALAARTVGLEVRFYYRGLSSDQGEKVASQVIETWIPPEHVQPFHTHHTLHEMTLIIEGEVVAVDSDTLSEEDLRASLRDGSLLSHGAVVRTHEMVIEGPGTRHTIVNATYAYAKLITVQTARMSLSDFPSDWHRDAPAS